MGRKAVVTPQERPVLATTEETPVAQVQEQASQLSDEEIAEKRLSNAIAELARLKGEYSEIEQAITSKQQECKRLQEEYDAAVATVNSLRATGEGLQRRKREAVNRPRIAVGTGEESLEQGKLTSIEVDIKQHGREYQNALQDQDTAEAALEQVPALQEEITILQAQLQEVNRLHAEMHTLYKEVHTIVGINRAAALRACIEAHEQIVKEKKQALEGAEQALSTEQSTIEETLKEWEWHAQHVRKTHGMTPVARTSEERILESWLGFVETLRDYGPKSHTHIEQQSIFELLTLPPSEIFAFCQPHNWRETPIETTRGERTRVLSNQRVDVVRRLLMRMKYGMGDAMGQSLY
jgi:hypothetical protein